MLLKAKTAFVPGLAKLMPENLSFFCCCCLFHAFGEDNLCTVIERNKFIILIVFVKIDDYG